MLGLLCRRVCCTGGLRDEVLLTTKDCRAKEALGEAVDGLALFRGARRRRAAAEVGRTPLLRRSRSTSRKPSRVLRSSSTGWEWEGVTRA